jgi:hypothetical protein
VKNAQHVAERKQANEKWKQTFHTGGAEINLNGEMKKLCVRNFLAQSEMSKSFRFVCLGEMKKFSACGNRN